MVAIHHVQLRDPARFYKGKRIIIVARLGVVSVR